MAKLEPEIVRDFVAESSDLLDSVEPKLIDLQHACDQTGAVDADAINAVFRLFHSMKGGAGMLELSNISSLTHAAENLLTLFRRESDPIALTRVHTDVLFKAMDLIRRMLEQLAHDGSDEGFEEEVAKIATELAAAAEDPAPMEMELPKEMIDIFVNEALSLLDTFESGLLRLEQSNDAEAAEDAFRASHSFKGNCGFMGFADLEKLTHSMETVLDGIKTQTIAAAPDVIAVLLNWIDLLRRTVQGIVVGGTGEISNCDVFLEFLAEMTRNWSSREDWLSSAEDQRKAPAPRSKSPSAEAAVVPDAQARAAAMQRQDIRVDLRKLDALINLVGELVIAEAMVTRHPAIAAHEDESVERAVHQLRRVSRELQDVAMSVRMVPLASTFQKMIRLVHDLSNKSGKKVDLELLGEDTEVDKTVIEQINDPLVHIVRNALDHGLEAPAERAAAGKSEVGHLTIEGKHEGGEVWILIHDDGRGLNREKILKKALDKELVTSAARDWPDSEVFNLIFEPGFSTADKITDVSGRGVGMDVVKKNIEKLKGRIDIYSEPGQGTTFILRIPLTLAIIEGMLVRVGDSSYTIPILNIRESIHIVPEQITKTPDGFELVRVREELFPVIRLHELFRKKPASEKLHEGILVIVESENRMVALFVDELLGQQETVIKGLSSYVGSARGVSGCTILGDGQVSLILDIRGVVAAAGDVDSGRTLPQVH